MPILNKLFKKWSDGSSLPGIVFTPKNLIPGEKCALLIFLHGVGEAGNGTLDMLYKLLSNPDADGPIKYAAMTDDFAFTNPLTGKVQKFIVLELQGIKGWAPFAIEVQNALQMGILDEYPVDLNAIFITGLSAGGQETANCITFGDPSLFAAAAPLSQAGQGQDLSKVIDANIKVWAMCGNADGSYTENARQFVSKLNALKPGLARLTLYPGGHGGWSKVYDPAYKEEFTVNGKKVMLNLYEWFLMNQKTDTPVVDVKPQPPIVEPPKPPVVEPVTLKADAGPDATIDAASSYIIDASKSVGQAVWVEQVGNKPTKVWFTDMSGLKKYQFKANNLRDGVYTFRISAQDKYGQTVTDDMILTVGKVEKKVVKYLITAVYDDGTKDAEKAILPENIVIKQ